MGSRPKGSFQCHEVPFALSRGGANDIMRRRPNGGRLTPPPLLPSGLARRASGLQWLWVSFLPPTTENAMRTVTDSCSICGKIIFAGDGAALVDAQVMHFFCYAADGRGPQTPASPISRDMLMGIHVLVVEDSRPTREMLLSALEHCGAFVTSAASVAEGKA